MKKLLLLSVAIVSGICGFANTPPATLYLSGNVGLGSGENGGIQEINGTGGIELNGDDANIYSVEGVVVANTGENQKGYVYFRETLGEEKGRTFGPATANAAIDCSGTNSWLPAVDMTEGTGNCYELDPGFYNFVVDCSSNPYKIQVQKHDCLIVDMEPIGTTGNYTALIDESKKSGCFLIRVGDKFYTTKEKREATTTTIVQPLGMGFELALYDFVPEVFPSNVLLKMATKEIIGNGSYTIINNRRFFYNPTENNFIAINSNLQITTGSEMSDMTYNSSSGTYTGTVGEISASGWPQKGFFIGINTDNYVYGEEITQKEGNLYTVTPQLFESAGYLSPPACACIDTNFSNKKVTFDPLAMTLLIGEVEEPKDPAAPEALYYCAVQQLKKEMDSNIYSGVVSIAPFDEGTPQFYVCENAERPYGTVIAVKETDNEVTPGEPKDFVFGTELFDGIWSLNGAAGLYKLSVNWDTKQMTVTAMSDVTIPEVPSFEDLDKQDYAKFIGDAVCEFNAGLDELYLSNEIGAVFVVELQTDDPAVKEALSPENFKRGDKLKNFSAVKLAKARTFSIFSFDLTDGLPQIEKAAEEMPVPEATDGLNENNLYKMVTLNGTLNISNVVGQENTITVDGTDYVILSYLADSQPTADNPQSVIMRAASSDWTLGDSWPTYTDQPGSVSGIVSPYNGGYAINAISIISSEDTTGLEDNMIDQDVPVVYYNMQGIRVDNPTGGIFLRQAGNKVEKIIVP